MNGKVVGNALSESARPKREEIVVFSIVRDSTCAECRSELGRGRFIRIENQRALCLACADLEHLVYLSRGDTALTRRATKYSTLRAVVVRFSRSRKRYERQGVLVEESALARAEQECLADTEARALDRERAAERRAELDADYIEAFAQHIGEIFPGCPLTEQRAIAEHACRKYSGRIGRSAAGSASRQMLSTWLFGRMFGMPTHGMTSFWPRGGGGATPALRLSRGLMNSFSAGRRSRCPVRVMTRAAGLGSPFDRPPPQRAR